MLKARYALAVAAFALVSCSTPITPASTPTSGAVTLHLYSTTATASLAQRLTDAYSQTHPQVAFDLALGDYAAAQSALLSGETALVLSNHVPLPSHPPPLLTWPLGQDGIAVIVHPANPVQNLTADQLRLIFRGQVANWRALGGEAVPIVVLSREEGSGTRAEFERLVMGARRTTPAAQIAPSTAAMLAQVAAQPGAIGYVALGALDVTRVRVLAVDGVPPTPQTVYEHYYPLRTTLYLIGQAEPQAAYYQFLSWAQSPDGQAVVAERHAPLLRP